MHVDVLSPADRVIKLVRGFNIDWKKSIELINQDVMESFPNFKNGTQILQVCNSIMKYENPRLLD